MFYRTFGDIKQEKVRYFDSLNSDMLTRKDGSYLS